VGNNQNLNDYRKQPFNLYYDSYDTETLHHSTNKSFG